MPKVNVTTRDGRVVAVDSEDATELTKASALATAAQTRANINEEASSGIVETGLAAIEGAADAATFGGYGKLRRHISDVEGTSGGRDMGIRAEQHPYARLAGEAAAVLAPTGVLGRTAATATKYTAAGLAGKAGAAVGGAAGLATEGAILGVGSSIAQTNVTGDPLTVDSVVAGAGVGALLNVGAGALGALISKGAGKVSKAISESAEKAAQSERIAVALEQLDSPVYRELKEAHEAAITAAKATNAEVSRVAKKYQEFLDGSNLFSARSAVSGTQAALDEIRNVASAGVSAARASGQPVTTDLLEAVADSQKRLTAIKSNLTANPAAAVEDLRVLHSELSQSGVRLPEIPPRPGQLVPVPEGELPKTLADFHRAHPDTVAKIANSVDVRTGEAIGKLADDLGLARGATSSETLEALHKTLGDYSRAAPAADKAGLVGILKTSAMSALGGALGGPAGALVGGALSAGNKLSTAITAARQMVSKDLDAIVAAAGVKAGAALGKLGPVTAVLSTNWLSGERDNSGPLSHRTLRRIAEIDASAATVGDTAFAAVQGLLGIPGDVAVSVSEHLQRAVEHLRATLPAPSATNTRMGGTDWSPAYHESLLLAYRLEAVQAPLTSIKRVLKGEGHPVAVDTLWTVYPALMADLGARIAASPEMSRATYQRASVYSMVFRTPMSGLQEPAVLATIQQAYRPRQQQQSAASTNPPGRPAAVQSPVAGSSVAALLGR